MHTKSWLLGAVGAFLLASPLAAQQGFTRFFPPAEFTARRAKVMGAIGDAVAVMQGTTERAGEEPAAPEQSVLLSDRRGRAAGTPPHRRTHQQTTLFLQPYNEGRAGRAIGPYPSAWHCSPLRSPASTWSCRAIRSRPCSHGWPPKGPPIVTPYRAEVLAASRPTTRARWRATTRRTRGTDGSPAKRRSSLISRTRHRSRKSAISIR